MSGASEFGPPTALPAVNQRLQVMIGVPEQAHLQLAESILSRVEDVIEVVSLRHQHELLIAAPSYAESTDPPPYGLPLTLQWSSVGGQLQLAVTFVRAEIIGGSLPVWRVEITGPGKCVQRREFVRAPVAMDLRIGLRTAASPRMKCRSLDLSEGGLRCLLPARLDAETPLVVWLNLGVSQVGIDAEVVRSMCQQAPRGKQWDTGIRFEDPERCSDVMRHVISAEQSGVHAG